jgi:methyl-accepting chemotaxis protein
MTGIHLITKLNLRMKFIAIISLLFIIQGALMSGFYLVQTTTSLKEELKQRGLSLAKNLAHNSLYGVMVGDTDVLNGYLSGISNELDVSYVMILDKQGKVLTATEKGIIGNVLSDDSAKKALNATSPDIYEYDSLTGLNYYDIISPILTKTLEPGLMDLTSTTKAGNQVGVVRIGISLQHLKEKRLAHFLISLGLTILIICAGILIALLFVTKIIRPIEQMAHVATRIADGDFTQTIEVHSQDEIGTLSRAFVKMSKSLNGMVKKIQTVSHQVDSVSGQIGQNINQVMEGAKLQANETETISSAIEQMNASIKEIFVNVEGLSAAAESTSSSILEMNVSTQEVASTSVSMASDVDGTSASIIEMNATIKEVAKNAETLSSSAEKTLNFVHKINLSVKEVETHSKQAASLSEKVTADAKELGMESVEKTISGMNKIKEAVELSVRMINQLGQRSEHIGNILTVIDEVTKQTNLLALNAAILAAQAGDQGKGFAVVADEIRNLADRTSTSTQEIAQMITDVREQVHMAIQATQSGFASVEEGIKLSLNGREALKKILESSLQATEMSHKIEKATIEQASQIKEITDSMELIGGMVRQIASATLQQKQGSEQILLSSEKMRDSTRGVQRSMQEQSSGSLQITKAIENVTDRVQHILNSIDEEKKGTLHLTGSMEEIRKISRKSVQQVKEMNQVGEILTQQAAILKEEVKKFKA